MNHSIFKNAVGGLSLAAISGVLIVVFQNCSPRPFESMEIAGHENNKAVYSGTGFISSEFTVNRGDQTRVSGNSIPELEAITGSSPSQTSISAGGGQEVPTLAAPKFSINSISLNDNSSVDVVVYQEGSTVQFGVINMENDAYLPVYIQNYHLSPVINASPHSIKAQSLGVTPVSGGTYHAFRLPLTDLARQSQKVVINIEGVCDIATGKSAPNFSTVCRSNSVAINLSQMDSLVTFSGPSAIRYGERLSSPFEAKGITGNFAGCNLEDRSGGAGSSPTGRVEDCRWLVNPSGWYEAAKGVWRLDQPFSGSDYIYAQFVVADIVNGRVRAVSPVLKVFLSPR